ncbi:hypothetical protein BD779DRAFT_1626610, partial [Infundibulicybe gibba]
MLSTLLLRLIIILCSAIRTWKAVLLMLDIFGHFMIIVSLMYPPLVFSRCGIYIFYILMFLE